MRNHRRARARTDVCAANTQAREGSRSLDSQTGRARWVGGGNDQTGGEPQTIAADQTGVRRKVRHDAGGRQMKRRGSAGHRPIVSAGAAAMIHRRRCGWEGMRIMTGCRVLGSRPSAGEYKGAQRRGQSNCDGKERDHWSIGWHRVLRPGDFDAQLFGKLLTDLFGQSVVHPTCTLFRRIQHCDGYGSRHRHP